MTFTGTKWAERLNHLATIEAGWYENGYGEVILPSTLNKADEILGMLDSPNFHVPGIYPMVDGGGIGMEWSQINGKEGMKIDFTEVSIEFNKDLQYEVFAMDSMGNPNDDILFETESFDEAMSTLRDCLIKSNLLTRCVTRD